MSTAGMHVWWICVYSMNCACTEDVCTVSTVGMDACS